MDNETIMAALYVVTVVILLWSRSLAYRHGICDGAFNQFLPHVQDAMREYDERRAEMILGSRHTTKEPRDA